MCPIFGSSLINFGRSVGDMTNSEKMTISQDDYLFSCPIHTKNLEWYLDYPSFRLLRLVHNYALDISVKYSAFNESIALQNSAFHLPRCISSRLYFLLKCNGMFKIYIIIRYNTVGFILWQKLAYPVFPNKLSYILFLGCSYDKQIVPRLKNSRNISF